MGFGLPWMLLGLIGVGAPILAHLLRRQKLPRQTLPTIAFLHRIHSTRAARLRVVDMLLLATRVLLIGLLALVAAQPFRIAKSSVADQQHALALVLDDSMSMSALDGGDTRLGAAIDAAQDAVAQLPEGSEVSVVLAGNPPRVWVRRNGDTTFVRDALGGLAERSIRGNALCDGVRTASDLLLESELANRRLVVVSDFTPGAKAEECDWPSRGISVSFNQMGSAKPSNRSIADVEVIGDREPGMPLSIEATIAGSELDQPMRVALRQRGQPITESDVARVGDRSVATLTIPEASASAVVELTLETDDALLEDNVRGVLLGSDTVHVLLVDGDPHPDPRKRETAFISQALEVAPQVGQAFAVETLEADDLSESSIIRADVVVLANAALDSKWLPLLRRFVAGGGSVWITAGDRITPRAYGSVLQELLPARYTATRTDDVSLGLEAPGLPELSDATVRGRTPIDEASLDATVTVRFSDGSPAMVEHRYENGRVAMFATTIDDAWTDLPYQPAFVPFVLKTLSRLAGRTEHAVAPFASVSLPGSTSTQRVQVVTPSGRTVDLPDGDRVAFVETEEIGAYRVLVNGVEGPRFAFVVDAPIEETDLTPGPVPVVDSSPAIGAAANASGIEQPLTPFLLLLTALLLLAELWLRQVRRR